MDVKSKDGSNHSAKIILESIISINTTEHNLLFLQKSCETWYKEVLQEFRTHNKTLQSTVINKGKAAAVILNPAS